MIGFYALEARPDFERITPSWFFESDYVGGEWLPGRHHWFFLLQSMLAISHLTDCQHCDVESIKYHGIVGDKHVWLAGGWHE